jgi:phage gpG-like protein
MFNINVSINLGDLDNIAELNTEDVLDEAAAFLIGQILKRFLAEQNPDGQPWLPSKAGIRRRLAGGTGTLFDTGRLFRSLQVYKDVKGQRRIGTDVPYAAKHQLGTHGMPVRAFLGVPKADEIMVSKILDLRVAEFLKARGV